MTENGKQAMADSVTAAAAAGNGTNEAELAAAMVATAVDVPSPEELEVLVEKAAKADEHWERVLRMTAEMENYRKRVSRERQEAVKYANESLLQKLLPALDNFEMAMAAANDGAGATVESIRTGVGMILSQVRQAMGEAGLEEVDATGQVFDPAWHEAVSQEESLEVPEGQVLRQIRKGYKLRDRLLRPAAVIVARRPEGGAAPEAAGG